MQERFSKFAVGVGGLLVAAMAIFMVKTMHEMTGYMAQMSGVMTGMGDDMASMRGDLSIMTTEVSKLDDVVAHMDENITAMNSDINVIQRSISSDMAAMRLGILTIAQHLHGMDQNMAVMTADVVKLDDLMLQIGADINRGTNSFTSPMHYMWNMMP